MKERFDLVIFMGVLYHLRHPLLALDLIHEHVARDLMLFQSMQRGSPAGRRDRRELRFLERRSFRQAPDIRKMHFIERRYAERSLQLVGAQRGLLRRHATQRRDSRSIAHPEEEVFLTRRVDASIERRRGLSDAGSAWRD